MDVKTYADHFGVHRSTIMRWRRLGYLQTLKLDGKVKVRALDERTRFGPVHVGL